MHGPTTRRQRAPRSTLPAGLFVAAAVGALCLLLVACGGAAPASPGAAPSTETPLPAASFTGGPARASVASPAAAAWTGGWCTRGAADAWLAVNIGDPNSAEYFGLVVGRDPHGAPDAGPAAGGGTFKGDAATVTWRHGGTRALVTTASVSVTIASDLSSGDFSGRLADGSAVEGRFSCG